MLFDEVDDFFVSSAKERDFNATYSPSTFIPANTSKPARDLDDLVPGSPFSLGCSVSAEAELEMLPLLELSPHLKPGQVPPLALGNTDPLDFMVPEASPASSSSPLAVASAAILGSPVEIYPAPLFVKSATLASSVSTTASSASSVSSSSCPSPRSSQSSPSVVQTAPGFPVIPFSGLAFMEHCVPSESPTKIVASMPSPASSVASSPISSATTVVTSPAPVAKGTPVAVSMAIAHPPREDDETRETGKTRKRRAPALASVPDHELNPDQLAKRMRRRQRNKESAQQSRQRKKQFMDELSDKVDLLTSENTSLRLQIRDAVAENELLKRTLHHHQIAIPRLPRPLFSQADHQA